MKNCNYTNFNLKHKYTHFKNLWYNGKLKSVGFINFAMTKQLVPAEV